MNCAPVDNAQASFIGYRPKDNAEDYAAEVLANEPPMDNQDPSNMCHGGPFAGVKLGEGIASMMGLDKIKKRTNKELIFLSQV